MDLPSSRSTRPRVGIFILLGGIAMLLTLPGLTACGGASPEPSPTSPQRLDVEPDTAQLWDTWAIQAREVASVTSRIYRSGQMLPSQAEEQQARARALAEEIRSGEPSNELVLRLADDLDEIVGALEFGLEYARNAGFPIIGVEIVSLEDALSQLVADTTALSEMLETN